MQIRGHDIGVCTWSLRPTDSADLIEKVRSLGLAHVHLGLNSNLASDASMIRDAGIEITATTLKFPGEDYTTISTIRGTGGFVPEQLWQQRFEQAIQAAKTTASIGVKRISLHVGFIPASSDEFYATLVERMRQLAQALAADGISLLTETGQETASELLQFLNDLNARNVAVNFDPGNMILYGVGDPIDAIQILNRHIRHVHVKDAISSPHPKMAWGKEVPFGRGEVDPLLLVDALEEIEYRGPLMIECETGDDRLACIQQAIEALKSTEMTE